MGYKVDFDALDTLYNSVSIRSNKWYEELESIKKKLDILSGSSNMSGVAADNIKAYIKNVHVLLHSSLVQLIQAVHLPNVILYRDDYRTNIDTGLQHTLLKEEELTDCKERVDITKNLALQIDSYVVYVLNGISDIFQTSKPDPSAVEAEHISVANFLSNLDEKIKSLENYHFGNDFISSDEMINALSSFIKEQLAFSRDYKTNFSIETLACSEAFGNLHEVSVKVQEEYSEKLSAIETAIENEKQRVADIEEQEKAKEDRKWVEWVQLGVAIAGSVALIVVTAGTASPLVCGVVGASFGVLKATTDNFAENYIENGSFTEGMNWSEFGKDCVVEGVTGFISGYAAGASRIGSAIKQPISKAVESAGYSMLESAAGGVIETTWEFGEAIYDRKPVDELLSIADENIDKMMKGIFVSGVENFTSGYVSGKFDVSSSKKGVFRKIGEDFIEESSGDVVEKGADALWDIGSAVLDSNSSETLSTVLKEEGKEFVKKSLNKVAENAVESIIGGINDNYNENHGDSNSKVKNIIKDSFVDTAADTSGSVAGSVTEQYLENKFSGESEPIDFNEIWEKDLEGGKKIVKSLGENSFKNSYNKFTENKKFDTTIKRESYDNGKVDVVVFDKYAVLKEDYEAAREVAGKGAYKNKTAQDILGLSKNTPISEKNVNYKTVSIDEVQKSEYKGRKTTNATKIELKKNN